jgi:hypothetical protein
MQLRFFYELYDYYGILAAFMLAQEVTYFVAEQAGQHS